MKYSTYLALILATAGHHTSENAKEATPDLSDVLQSALDRIHVVVERLRQGPLSPLSAGSLAALNCGVVIASCADAIALLWLLSPARTSR